MTDDPKHDAGQDTPTPEPKGETPAKPTERSAAPQAAGISDETAIPAAERRPFGKTFWMLNSIEMFERLAYFGIRAVVPIYIMQATEPGGLHMTAVHKGIVYMWWAILQSWLPMFTGGIADRYGYKKVLFFSITANAVGYLMMAFLHSYAGFFAGILVLATGTAFFKPALQGSIAQSLDQKTASMGWGIFYWVVNIGAALAPILATALLGKPHSADGWRNLFIASAIYSLLNLFLLLTFKDVPSGADKDKSLLEVFIETVENIWPYWFRGGMFVSERWIPGLAIAAAGLSILIYPKWLSEALDFDYAWAIGAALLLGGVAWAVWLRNGVFTWQLRLPAFLLIMSCFWMMMYQLWDLHPNFIEDWVDSSKLASKIPLDSWKEYGDRGLIRVPQQILLTFYNSILIIILIVPLSWLVRRMRTLSAMLIGMSVATVGVLVAGLSSTGMALVLGITFFSFGEMLTGPKKNQYLALIAPPGKKGLYLGYVNIPVGVGVGFGSLIAGLVYDRYGEKAGLALDHLAAQSALVAEAAPDIDWSDSLDKLPDLLGIDRTRARDLVADQIGGDAATDRLLLDTFAHDEGQITNLALQYLTLLPEEKEARTEKMIEVLREKEADKPEFAKTAANLESKQITLQQVPIARHLQILEDVVGRKRPEALAVVMEHMNSGRAPENQLGEEEVTRTLWDMYGQDPEVLNNLALEYLAQATPRLEQALAAHTFDAEELEDRREELEDRFGIGRPKAFDALSASLGAADEEVQAALAEIEVAGDDPDAAAYVFLVQQPHHRFIAMARKDWTHDVVFLERILADSDEAQKAAEAALKELGAGARLMRSIKAMFGGSVAEDASLAERIASEQKVIKAAFDAKDWSRTPEQAAQLLRLNPFEARSQVATEVSKARIAATSMLWEEYNPQYKVWIPFAAIGFLAMIALGIFGQKAKRWADMNA
jgi:MFS family permease